MKKSSDSPIRVDRLRAEDVGLAGSIGLTIAPGKKDEGRGWDRDLDLDLERLGTEYGCRLLVSLMETHEYEFLGIGQLFERAHARGIETIHFPIEDVSVPAEDEMPRFVELIEKILATARTASNVVIHCRGGVGRSGMVAACCLVALGHAPKEAIRRVRAVRQGAVETQEQEQWVRAFARVQAEADEPGRK